MSKYKQKIIPIVDDDQFIGMTLGQLKDYIKTYYNTNLKGSTIINKHKGISIQFGREGIRHLLYARKIGYTKLKAVVVLNQLMINSVYCNFKEPDITDTKEILGYLNFKAKVCIEDKIHLFRIVVRLTISGKFYYDHAVRVKK